MILKGRRVNNVADANLMLREMLHDNKSKIKSEFCDLLSPFVGSIVAFAPRLLILKLPILSNGKLLEKGAVIFKFSETFGPIYLSLDINLLSQYFRIILEPSSAGYSTEEILTWIGLSPEKVIVFSPYHDDFNLISELHTNLVPVRLGAADWVNQKTFYKIGGCQKIYDAICVANFNPVKRVDRYIRAVARIKRSKPDFNASLVCVGLGSARTELLTLLNKTMYQTDIKFFPGMKQNDLNIVFNRSKVNVFLSLREGASKVLTEGFFSGVPALMLNENVGVNRTNINSQTGKAIPDSNLEDGLIWFSRNYHEFSPHVWAKKHISPEVSTQNLSKILKQIEISEGRQWTKDLLPKVNQPELDYLNPDDRWLLARRGELLKRFSRGSDSKSAVDFLEQLKKS